MRKVEFFTRQREKNEKKVPRSDARQDDRLETCQGRSLTHSHFLEGWIAEKEEACFYTSNGCH